MNLIPPVWVIDLGFGVFCTASGVAGAMWLRSRAPREHCRDDDDRSRDLTEEAVRGLHAAVENVQNCVVQHSECLSAINASLKAGDASDAAASIVEANQLAEHQFQELKGDLAAQATQVRQESGPRNLLKLATMALDRQRSAYQRVLHSLEDLATEMSAELDGCGQKLRDVSAGLEATEQNSATEVRHAIGEILDAVDLLGQTADAAEVQLEESARKICMQAVLSHADLLTALPNRRALEEQLDRESASNGQRPRPCSLLVVDLDGFAEINKRYGYSGGDAVLRQAAMLLKRIARSQDTPARLAGDCFAMTLSGATLSQGMPLAERTRGEFAGARFSEGRSRLSLTASVGVVQLQRGERPSQAIVRATMAAKDAAQAGGDAAYYNDGQQCFPISVAHRTRQEESAASDSPEYPTASALGVDGASPAETPGHPELEPEAALCGRSVFVGNVKRRLAEWNRGGAIVSVLLMRVDQIDVLSQKYSPGTLVFLRRVLGRLLQAATRDMDQRCDYEEGVYAVLLPGADEATAMAVADRLRSQVANCKLRLGDELWDLSASIGVADAQAGATVVDVLMAAAAGMELAVRHGGDAAYAFTQLAAQEDPGW